MNFVKPIGGYLELETANHATFYDGFYKFNTARSCLEVLMCNLKPTKIWLPYYICDVLFEPLKRLSIPIQFYNIDRALEVINIPSIEKNEFFLYVNYFGLKNKYIYSFLTKHFKNVIIDNSQAFFSTGFESTPAFYSCRKFFGVPDGAYLNKAVEIRDYDNYEFDQSFERFEHLLKRVELGAEAGYLAYQNNEANFIGAGVRQMSILTRKILASVDYSQVNQRRIDNYKYVHAQLSEFNELSLPKDLTAGPMAYPFLCKVEGLRDFLIINKVFVPTYWENVRSLVDTGQLEFELVEYLLPLPIDQNCTIEQLSLMILLIKEFINGKR